MPVREETHREICSICDGLTDAHCLRCRLPLCETHMPEADRRCDSCENDYENRVTLSQFGRWMLRASIIPVVLLAIVAGVLAGLGHASPVLAAAVVGAVPFLVAVSAPPRRREAKRRAEFLAERR